MDGGGGERVSAAGKIYMHAPRYSCRRQDATRKRFAPAPARASRDIPNSSQMAASYLALRHDRALPLRLLRLGSRHLPAPSTGDAPQRESTAACWTLSPAAEGGEKDIVRSTREAHRARSNRRRGCSGKRNRYCSLQSGVEYGTERWDLDAPPLSRRNPYCGDGVGVQKQQRAADNRAAAGDRRNRPRLNPPSRSGRMQDFYLYLSFSPRLMCYKIYKALGRKEAHPGLIGDSAFCCLTTFLAHRTESA